MNNMDKVNYWVEIAVDDLCFAKECLKINRFLYVGFMCHQTIEKILKAMHVVKFPSDTPPYTHNLLKLAQATGLYELMSLDQKKIIANLEPLNIEARYPSKKKEISTALSKERCELLIKQTEGLNQWIKAQL
jgi:HEPN domain-containing protein